jgi:hypothetical protein
MKKFIVMLALGLVSIVGLCAPKDSPWREIQVVEIPSTVEIHTGVTKSGNSKAWIELPEIGKVSVSPKGAEKFKNGEVKLELVKWYNDTTKKYRYSTRQVKSGNASTSSADKNVDLGRVFK